VTEEELIINLTKTLNVKPYSDLFKGYKIFLFGSRAKGVNTKKSDFDIGVLGEKPLAAKAYFELESILDSLPTLLDFDLVDFSKVSDDFKEEALSNIKLIYG
jgi:predicted nucleotidyltransferase